MSGGILFCDACKRRIPELSWLSHVAGGGHRKMYAEYEKTLASVHMTNLKQKFSEQDLLGYIAQFGPVRSVRLHSNLNAAAVIFENVLSAGTAVNHTPHRIKNHTIYITKMIPAKELKNVAQKQQLQGSASLEIHLLRQLGAIEDVDAQMLWLMQEWSQPEKRSREVLAIASSIERAVQAIIPEVTLKPFGSAVNGLGSHGCDIDVLFQLSDVQHTPGACKHPMPQTKGTKIVVHGGCIQVSSLKQLPKDKLCMLITSVLRISKAGLVNFQPIPSARIPVIKFQARLAKFDVDLSFGSGLALRNTQLIRVLLELDPRVKVLMYSVRFWSKRAGFGSTQNYCRVTSYSLFLMVYFYLENTKPRVLPTVEQLSQLAVRLGCSGPVIDGWDCSFFDDVPMISSSLMSGETNTQTAPELLRGFFRFYAELDILNNVLCPRTGATHPVMDFRRTVQTNPKLRDFKFRYVFLQDPFELSHNTMHSLNGKASFQLSMSLIQANYCIEKCPTYWKLPTIIPKLQVSFNDDITFPDTDPLAVVMPFNICQLPEPFWDCSSSEEAKTRWYDHNVDVLLKFLDILGISMEIGDLIEGEAAGEIEDRNNSDDRESEKKRQKSDDGKAMDTTDTIVEEPTIFDTPMDAFEEVNLEDEPTTSKEEKDVIALIVNKKSRAKRRRKEKQSAIYGSEKVMQQGTCLRCETKHQLWQGRFNVMKQIRKELTKGNEETKGNDETKGEQKKGEEQTKGEEQRKGEEQAKVEEKGEKTKVEKQTEKEKTKKEALTKEEVKAKNEAARSKHIETFSQFEIEEKVTAILSAPSKGLLNSLDPPLKFDIYVRRVEYGWKSQIDITVESEQSSLIVEQFRTFMSGYGAKSLRNALLKQIYNGNELNIS